MTATGTRPTIAYTGVLEVLDCGECHVDFAIDQGWLRNLRTTGDWFYCPNGHRIHYYKTEQQKLRAENERLEQQLASARIARDAARDQAQAAHRSAIAHKGHATRLRKRAAAGVCPCCTRSFQNLKRHMDSQHPTFAQTEAQQ